VIAAIFTIVVVLLVLGRKWLLSSPLILGKSPNNYLFETRHKEILVAYE
jgi:hypothetical protein